MMEKGTIQKEDALLLQAIIKMTAPLKLVEIGYLEGDSAQIMLDAMRSDAQLICYDNNPATTPLRDKRMVLKHQDQEKYNEQDVDFVFLDASHNATQNFNTLRKILPSLTPGAIVAIHDTGAWEHCYYSTGEGYYLYEGGPYLHRPGERDFVNRVAVFHPELQQINFHTLREIRHGMTLLQKYNKLNI